MDIRSCLAQEKLRLRRRLRSGDRCRSGPVAFLGELDLFVDVMAQFRELREGAGVVAKRLNGKQRSNDDVRVFRRREGL